MSASQLAKPQLRGLLKSRVKRDFGIAFAFSAVCTVAYKFLVNEPRKAKYAEFYKTYDAQADFERMKKEGVFQSVTPDGKVGEW
ncbi:cytochrome c oxidase subunit 6C-like [Liolophura sinensis]|uniref:cytochrome c oxidase subunit 6C-like n=1 Tax=Liolophura sinensis TaxID=3198878 RepID=UPI0031585B7D